MRGQQPNRAGVGRGNHAGERRLCALQQGASERAPDDPPPTPTPDGVTGGGPRTCTSAAPPAARPARFEKPRGPAPPPPRCPSAARARLTAATPPRPLRATTACGPGPPPARGSPVGRARGHRSEPEGMVLAPCLALLGQAASRDPRHWAGEIQIQRLRFHQGEGWGEWGLDGRWAMDERRKRSGAGPPNRFKQSAHGNERYDW